MMKIQLPVGKVNKFPSEAEGGESKKEIFEVLCPFIANFSNLFTL